MCLQVHRKYSAAVDENTKLKVDLSVMCASLKTREGQFKELEVKVQEDREKKSKVMIVTQQNKYTETLVKASVNTKVSNYIATSYLKLSNNNALNLVFLHSFRFSIHKF